MPANGVINSKKRGYFQGKYDRVRLSDKALLTLVNRYIQENRQPDGRPSLTKVQKKLGWNPTQWQKYRRAHEGEIILDRTLNHTVIVTPEVNDEDSLKQALLARGIEPEAIAQKIGVSYNALRTDLACMGLSVEEITGCVAMQNFGENRFANAMEIISSGVFKTAVKLEMQQRSIEERLDKVRDSIYEYGTMVCDERDSWVKEENGLVKQLAIVGKLLSDIQKTWYEGSAQLALVQMRMRDSQDGKFSNPTNLTQRSNRPRFTPKVMEAEEITQTEAVQSPQPAPAPEP
jgi:hypothetical protein